MTFNLSDKESFGKISRSNPFEAGGSTSAGSGVDSSNDGVAVGLGIISGFSFLSGTILIASIKRREDVNL